jgi:site-specific DNA-cytosine methylase
MKPLEILIACEFSGIVRDAFLARGHNAISCDIDPSESDKGLHYQGDVRDILYSKYWDIVIAHPPCTYLTLANNARLNENIKNGNLFEALRFYKMFLELYPKHTKSLAIENPPGAAHRWYGKADQIIHPWQFGHGEKKKTALHLKNLPKLIPTNIVAGREERILNMAPSASRSKDRSRFYTGIAKAMAEQWG